MKTPASIKGHPIHPMLVTIPIGCWILSFVSDLVFLSNGNANPWNTVAYYAMLFGILGALAAAVFGLVDLLSLPSGYTKSVGIKHMSINLIVVAIYVCNAWLRSGNPSSLKLPILLSLVTILMLLVSGWLGGKMVYEAGVGVDTTAK
jgi:uncharacterized membrane protein